MCILNCIMYIYIKRDHTISHQTIKQYPKYYAQSKSSIPNLKSTLLQSETVQKSQEKDT